MIRERYTVEATTKEEADNLRTAVMILAEQDGPEKLEAMRQKVLATGRESGLVDAVIAELELELKSKRAALAKFRHELADLEAETVDGQVKANRLRAQLESYKAAARKASLKIERSTKVHGLEGAVSLTVLEADALREAADYRATVGFENLEGDEIRREKWAEALGSGAMKLLEVEKVIESKGGKAS